jgi:hypothetical protein
VGGLKITETLDQLLRLLLATEEARPQDATGPDAAHKASDPERTDTVSVGARLPIRESVHAWNTNDVPAPVDDAVAPTLRGPERPVTPVDASAADPEERALPDWVRRVQAHRVDDEPSHEAVTEDRVETAEPAVLDGPAPETPLRAPLANDFPDESESVEQLGSGAEPVVAAPAAAEDTEPGHGEGIQAASAPAPEPEPAPEPVSAVALEQRARDEDSAVARSAHLLPAVPDIARLEATSQVVESMSLGFHLGSAVERIAAAAGQGSEGVAALREASWLIERYIALIERRPIGADLHLSARRLARTGDVIADIRAALDSAEREP